MHFQPIVSLRDDTVVGFEALARWCDADLGYVSPAVFVPLAEDELEDCRRALLSGFDAIGDTLASTELWYYNQILRDEALAPPEYEKVLTEAVTREQIQQALRGYSYSVCYAVTADGQKEETDDE